MYSVTPRRRSTSCCVRNWLRALIVALTTVTWLLGAEALRNDVVNAGRFAHRPDGGAGDHARARIGRHQHHVGRAELGPHDVRDRAAPTSGTLTKTAAGLLLGLFDSRRNFVRLAIAPADAALAVADDDHGRKAEPPAALDHRGAALDLHRLVDEFAARFARCDSCATCAVLPVVKHCLKAQAGFAGRIRQGRDAAVVLEMTPIEADLLDARRDRLFGDGLADRLGGRPCCRRSRPCSRKSLSSVLTETSVLPAASSMIWHATFLMAAKHRQPRPLGRAANRLAHAVPPPLPLSA